MLSSSGSGARRRRTLLIVAAGLVACGAVLAPWVIRNRVQVGCFALTTDSRALWEANNPLTYYVLRHGGWIDNVALPASFPPSAQDAGREYRRHGVIVSVDECAQVPFYQHKVISASGSMIRTRSCCSRRRDR